MRLLPHATDELGQGVQCDRLTMTHQHRVTTLNAQKEKLHIYVSYYIHVAVSWYT